MFILGTADTILWVCEAAINIQFLQEILEADGNLSTTFGAEYLHQLGTFHMAAEIVPIIWGSRKKVVIFPATLILSTAVIALLQTTSLGLTFAMFAVTNLVLVGFTGDWIRMFIVLS
ncbi:hypothetical protein GGX14DRAFT_408254 [Mycena pura]|uniref:Uncharacterized protein n=1 Tax=Mycena pura TaxID=153505 RepID=A0AAD6UQK2_9AGAR|nr:hypothetical protein GGX14DRAFT_408254 [Mycena pura]